MNGQSNRRGRLVTVLTSTIPTSIVTSHLLHERQIVAKHDAIVSMHWGRGFYYGCWSYPYGNMIQSRQTDYAPAKSKV